MSDEDEDFDKRAAAFAKVLLEYFPNMFAHFQKGEEEDRFEFAINSALWEMVHLTGESGGLMHWNKKRQLAAIDTAIKALKKARNAFSKLSKPVADMMGDMTREKLRAGYMITKRPPGFGTFDEKTERIVYSDYESEILNGIVASSFSAQVTTSRCIKAIEDSMPEIKKFIDSGREPEKRRWPALEAYVGLRALWLRERNETPPVAYSETGEFVDFVRDALDALEIEGTVERTMRAWKQKVDASELEGDGLVEPSDS